MNILINDLPYTVDINGVTYPINTDFRAGISFEIMVQRGEVDGIKLLQPFFPDGIPYDIDSAIRAVHLFYCCGSIPEKKENRKKEAPAYSFEVDSGVIFADFWNYYGVNLSQDCLHWWVFCSLLENLPSKSGFKQRIYYRKCETKELHKSERERILKIRSRIAIKTGDTKKMTLEERNKKMIDYLAMRREEIKGGGT